jgi:hypothetical protein
MDFSKLLEIVNLSYFSAYNIFGICSSVIETSSDVGLKDPPEIILKWINAKIFWLAFSTML